MLVFVLSFHSFYFFTLFIFVKHWYFFLVIGRKCVQVFPVLLSYFSTWLLFELSFTFSLNLIVGSVGHWVLILLCLSSSFNSYCLAIVAFSVLNVIFSAMHSYVSCAHLVQSSSLQKQICINIKLIARFNLAKAFQHLSIIERLFLAHKLRNMKAYRSLELPRNGY